MAAITTPYLVEYCKVIEIGELKNVKTFTSQR